MKKEILSILDCPICHNGEGNLRLVDEVEKKNEIFSGLLHCNKGHKFEIKDYIVHLYNEEYDTAIKDSHIYDLLWGLHEKIYYSRKVEEYSGKFNNYARLPGDFKQHFNKKLILDVGCGEGRFSFVSSEMGASHVIALDYSLTALKRAIKQTKNPHNISFIRSNLSFLPFKKEAFDFIFSFGVLHHTKNTYLSFKNLIQYLKQSGLISIYVYRKRTLPLIQWLLRPITLKISKVKIAKLCDFFGFTYTQRKPPVIPLSRLFRKIGRFDVLGISNITYEGLTTLYLWEHTHSEVRKWFRDLNLDIISSTNIVSMSGRKK